MLLVSVSGKEYRNLFAQRTKEELKFTKIRINKIEESIKDYRQNYFSLENMIIFI